MEKYILTVTLNPAVDKTVKIKNFCLGKTFLEEHVVLSAGGKGINVSRVLGRLKVNNLATGFIGGPAGNFITHQLDRQKIQHKFVEIRENTRTSLTIVDPAAKKTTRILQPGPILRSSEIQEFRKKFDALLGRSSLVIMSGRNAAGASPSLYSDLVKMAKKKKIRTIIDTHGDSLRLSLKSKPFCIKPNLKEAEAVIGKKLNSPQKIKNAIRYFQNHGIKAAIISLGAEGAMASDGEMIWHAVSPNVKCRNSVGCGDALVGGFACAFEKGLNFHEALRYAIAAGTANTLSLQPGLVTQEMVKKVYKDVKMKLV